MTPPYPQPTRFLPRQNSERTGNCFYRVLILFNRINTSLEHAMPFVPCEPSIVQSVAHKCVEGKVAIIEAYIQYNNIIGSLCSKILEPGLTNFH